ncbi:peptidyl-prolyl cis-trans isomerase [Candidatus Uhrbacteria bacterium]|nr:peptidyl-prolyl cis-trans isomerase [Candidatus Uhrbacteria bacterium]
MTDETIPEQNPELNTEDLSPEIKKSPFETPVAPWKLFLKSPKGKLVVVLGILVVLLGFLTKQVYARPVTDSLVRTVSQVIPYPALSVNSQIVTMKEFLIEYDALMQYFGDAGEQTPPADQLEMAIADTLINKVVIQQLADEYDVKLDADRVEAYFQDVLSAQESEEAFEQSLEETFGWTSGEFKERIVQSIVLALQMTDVIFEDETLQQSRLDLIQGALSRLQTGEDFLSVADDVHAGFDGVQSDLGYIQSSVIPEAWSEAVNALEVGQITDIITLPEGYVIFKLEEKIPAGEDTQLRLFSITIPKKTLEEVVDTYLETAKVKRYVGQE